MTKFKKLAATAAIAAAALIPVSSQAVLISGVNFNAGGQFITTDLWESPLGLSTDSLFGVGIVNSIKCSGCGGVTWTGGQNDTQLTYYFSGYTVSKWYDTLGAAHNAGDEGTGVNTFANARAIDFLGGNVKLFTDRVSTGTLLDPSINPNAINPLLIAADIAKATDGSLWLEYAGVATSGANGRSGTLLATADQLNSVHAGATGFGYLNVQNTGGAATNNFDTNSYTIGNVVADARIDSSFSTSNAGAWPLNGTASFKTSAIPEPGSLALLGLGLLGLAAARRKSV